MSIGVDGSEDTSYSRQVIRLDWSRREDLNTPSADYRSAALTLSYTGENGECLVLKVKTAHAPSRTC
jgi:hypothetical protein